MLRVHVRHGMPRLSMRLIAGALLIALPAAALAQDPTGELKAQIAQLTQQLQQQQQVIQQMKTRLDAMEQHEVAEKAAPPREAPPAMVASAPPIPVAPPKPPSALAGESPKGPEGLHQSWQRQLAQARCSRAGRYARRRKTHRHAGAFRHVGDPGQGRSLLQLRLALDAVRQAKHRAHGFSARFAVRYGQGRLQEQLLRIGLRRHGLQPPVTSTASSTAETYSFLAGLLPLGVHRHRRVPEHARLRRAELVHLQVLAAASLFADPREIGRQRVDVADVDREAQRRHLGARRVRCLLEAARYSRSACAGRRPRRTFSGRT